MHDWMYSLAGLLVGAMVGATGVGGGSVMTPLLILLMGVAPHTAVGTDLLYASLTKMVGVSVHHSEQRVDWQIVRRLATGSLPAAIATLLWMHLSQSSGVRSGVIIVALGIVLLITALTMVMRPYLNRLGKYLRITDPARFRKYQPILTVTAGAVLGFMVALTSIGAGALCAVMLLFLYPLRLTPAKLVATDLAHAIPLALVAGAGHILLGNVDFIMLGWLLLGSIPGIIIGAHFGGKLPDRLLQVAIAVVLGSVGLKLLG
ncbi:putative membrane transporter protein YjnA [Georgfuchsia toluolica]|uniref:Probable membrane transporter protein n=1 Tax=Georgfuchsia toluolica TaxID=424218 RepID=A0A916J376_9PROT|nr:sulfite exporter TauE/SafE family protein [Georgfuchsia toluolica]CAG4883349.1 putative membrane transporter protein YjnA [Georgfuchsia toluolica]